MTGRKQAGMAAMVIAIALLLWVVVKAMVIGYYPNQVVPELVVPGVIGAVFYGAAKILTRD